MTDSKLTQFLHGTGKWRFLWITLLGIVVVSSILSVLTRVTIVEDDVETRPHLAVVLPADSREGKMVLQGAKVYVEKVNTSGGWNGRRLELLTFDEQPGVGKKVTADKNVIAAVGFLNKSTFDSEVSVLQKAGIPLVTTRYLDTEHKGVMALGMNPVEEARFIANYARNIQQQRMMYVIREESNQYDSLVEAFAETYQRFDTPVQNTWSLSTDASEADLAQLAKEVTNIDFGAIYIATNSELAAKLVKMIKGTGNPLEIFGTSKLTTSVFAESLQRLSGQDAGMQSHGLIAATPVLYDTANDESQRFRTKYQQTFLKSPDWMASLGYDAALLSLSKTINAKTVQGLSSEYNLVQPEKLPIQIGVYNSDNLISAPIQLLPLAKGANFNYIDALRQGRVLYVNDRFMFKTNVVYTGFAIHEISEVDRQDETAVVDMSIWFRYKGKFSPEDLEIANVVEPIKFDQIEEKKETADLRYYRYRVKAKFNLNFTEDERAYNTHIAGISFRHKLLNRNNLSYVVDVLGMPTGSALLNDLQNNRVIRAGTSWRVDNAWVSQKVAHERGNGAPQYIGMTGEQPLYSTITLGILLKPDAVVARDMIDAEYFIYIAIFGLIGSLVALMMDIKQWGRYSVLHSWILRLVFWPMFLLAVGNLLIDTSFSNWTPGVTRSLVLAYDSLWWIIAARLLDMTIRRFIWIPLEARAGRPIPNVMKLLASVVLYSFAFAGITAFVFNQTLTSLLATSGVLAMVVGFAIQANIANIFSGIILNIERPFKVGDYIKVENVFGRVADITWRTVRIESYEGPIVSLTNAKVSESKIENHNEVPKGLRMELVFHTAPDLEPEQIQNIVKDVVENADYILDGKYELQFTGIENVNGQWVAAYVMRFKVKNFLAKIRCKGEFWMAMRTRFIEQSIPLLPAKNTMVAPINKIADVEEGSAV